MSKITYPDKTLSNNEATMELLIRHSGGTREELEEIARWGRERKERIGILRRLAGLLDQKGVFRSGKEKMDSLEAAFTIHHCVAIASKHGLDMKYEFNDNEYGPFSPDLHLDLHAVTPVPVNIPTGLFPSDADESAFLEAIEGKDADEIGKFARLLVIEERYRILI